MAGTLDDDATSPVSRVGARVLRYLMEHPAAGDTVEGILDWWVTRCDASIERRSVEESLDELERMGLVTVLRAADSRAHYRLNGERIGDVRAFLNRAQRGEDR